MIRTPLHPGALGQRHGHVDRVGPAVLGDVEAGQHVVGAGQREQAPSPRPARSPARRRRSSRLNAATRRYSSSRPASAASSMKPTCLQPGGQARSPPPAARTGRGCSWRISVDVSRRGAEGDHQAGRVPGGAGGEPVPLQQHDVGPAGVGQVVGDRGADDPTADDHDPGARGHGIDQGARGLGRSGPLCVRLRSGCCPARPGHAGLGGPRQVAGQVARAGISADHLSRGGRPMSDEVTAEHGYAPGRGRQPPTIWTAGSDW